MKLHIDTRKELEWHLRHRTLSLDNISCEENGKDFRNCSYSFGRIVTEKSFQLILACEPSPGECIEVLSFEPADENRKTTVI